MALECNLFFDWSIPAASLPHVSEMSWESEKYKVIIEFMDMK